MLNINVNILATLALLILAACSTSGGPPTMLKGDVASGCIESRSAYNGHRLACESLAREGRPCLAADLAVAKRIQNEAKLFCESNLPSTPANLATIRAMVGAQRAVGRTP